MDDILKEIFDSDLYDDCEVPEKLQDLRAQEAVLWEKFLPALGLDAIDEINNHQAEINYESCLMWFRRGFRLGALLMLELPR